MGIKFKFIDFLARKFQGAYTVSISEDGQMGRINAVNKSHSTHLYMFYTAQQKFFSANFVYRKNDKINKNRKN